MFARKLVLASWPKSCVQFNAGSYQVRFTSCQRVKQPVILHIFNCCIFLLFATTTSDFDIAMPPTKKRAVPLSSSSASKKQATAKGRAGKQQQHDTTQKSMPTLPALGFSKSKRPTYQIGTKILLDDSIYDDKVPAEVKKHMFVYEIIDVHENGKIVCLVYKHQVIREGGDKFRVYRDSDDPQVRISLCSCNPRIIFSFPYFSNLSMPHSNKVLDSKCRADQAGARSLVSSEQSFECQETSRTNACRSRTRRRGHLSSRHKQNL